MLLRTKHKTTLNKQKIGALPTKKLITFSLGIPLRT